MNVNKLKAIRLQKINVKQTRNAFMTKEEKSALLIPVWINAKRKTNVALSNAPNATRLTAVVMIRKEKRNARKSPIVLTITTGTHAS